MRRAKKKARKAAQPRKIMLAGTEYKLEKGGKLEWNGHMLNPAQVEQLSVKVRERLDIASRNSDIKYPGDYARRVGFSDLLWMYRPSVLAKNELLDLSNALGNAAVTIGTLRSFHFYSEGAAQQQGGELLQQLAREAERLVTRIRHLSESIKLEGSTKLQDWTYRQRVYEEIL